MAEPPPPTYSQVEEEDAANTAAAVAAADAQIGNSFVQQTVHSEGRQNTANRHAVTSRSRRNITNRHVGGSERRQNNAHRHATIPRDRQNTVYHHAARQEDSEDATDSHNMDIEKLNTSHSFSGFIDVMHDKKKLPWDWSKVIIYKVGLLVYYFANFIYSIVAAAVQREPFVFYLVYMIVSFIGFLFKLVVIIVHIKKQCTQSSDDRTSLLDSNYGVTHTNQPHEAHSAVTQVPDNSHKAKKE